MFQWHTGELMRIRTHHITHGFSTFPHSNYVYVNQCSVAVVRTLQCKNTIAPVSWWRVSVNTGEGMWRMKCYVETISLSSFYSLWKVGDSTHNCNLDVSLCNYTTAKRCSWIKLIYPSVDVTYCLCAACSLSTFTITRWPVSLCLDRCVWCVWSHDFPLSYLGFKLSDAEHREILCKTCQMKVLTEKEMQPLHSVLLGKRHVWGELRKWCAPWTRGASCLYVICAFSVITKH